MILSNLLFILKNKTFYSSQDFQSKYSVYNCNRINKLNKVSRFKHCIEKPVLLYKLIAKNSTNDLSTSTNYPYIHMTDFLKNFVNRYWQETLVISYVDIDKKATNINNILYSNEYKNLLIDFGKALVNGKIIVYFNQSEGYNLFQSPFSFHSQKSQNINANNVRFYNWKKSLNFLSFKDIFTLFRFYIKNLSPHQISLIYKHYKEYHVFPIFSVVNIFNQMILAESVVQSNLSMYKTYNNSTQNTYTGLFFINPKDALEYKKSIDKNYKDITDNKLKVFSSKLAVYHKLSTLKLIGNTQFKLMPDLRELSKLLTEYQYYKNIHFKSSQIYGKDYFQGQPIYTIQPILGINKKTKKQELVYYSYNFSKETCYSTNKAIFFNFKTVLHAWNKFKEQCHNYDLPSSPKVEVFNLESLLKEQTYRDFNKNKIIFIPSYEAYKYVTKSFQVNLKYTFTHKLLYKMIYLKVIGRRILWSLTSRQPIQW